MPSSVFFSNDAHLCVWKIWIVFKTLYYSTLGLQLTIIFIIDESAKYFSD